MIRNIAAAFAATLLVAACSTNSNTEAPSVEQAFDTYLPWDANGKDVQTLDNGIQYIVLKKGEEGGASPIASDTVEVNYEGRLTTGEKFDSSYDRGESISFPLNRVISGWTIGLQEMVVGDDYLFYIPTDLGYGQNPRPGGVIKPGDDLIFRIELLDIVVPKTADAEAWEKYMPWNPDLPEVQKTESGLQYIVLASGDPAGPSPENGEFVSAHYEGRLAETNEKFDSSFERGEPLTLPSNQVIPGWVEALELMKEGDRWLVYIPSEIGYGETGTPGGPIPPNSDLVFELDLEKVMKRG